MCCVWVESRFMFQACWIWIVARKQLTLSSIFLFSHFATRYTHFQPFQCLWSVRDLFLEIVCTPPLGGSLGWAETNTFRRIPAKKDKYWPEVRRRHATVLNRRQVWSLEKIWPTLHAIISSKVLPRKAHAYLFHSFAWKSHETAHKAREWNETLRINGKNEYAKRKSRKSSLSLSVLSACYLISDTFIMHLGILSIPVPSSFMNGATVAWA